MPFLPHVGTYVEVTVEPEPRIALLNTVLSTKYVCSCYCLLLPISFPEVKRNCSSKLRFPHVLHLGHAHIVSICLLEPGCSLWRGV
jgi:hypothetical protein